MNIQNIDISKINIQNPQEIDDSYVFHVNYDDTDFEFITNDRVIFQSKDTENNLILCVTNKQDLKSLYEVYNCFIEKVYNNQSSWFESEFDLTSLKKIFEQFLTINIEENCVNILCSYDDKDNSNFEHKEIVPLFSINELIYKDGTFKINLKLKSYEPYISNQQVSSNVEDENNDTKKDVKDIDNKEESLMDEINENHENHDNHEKHEDIGDNEDEMKTFESTENNLEEINIPTSNLENIELDINEDDFYLFYKTIQGNIYKNTSNSLKQIFEEKQISTNDIDLNEIIYDSDDESEFNDESSNISDNDFEESMRDLM